MKDLRQFIRSQAADMHWLTALLLWGFFVLLTFSLIPIIGTAAGAFLIIPAAILSWFLDLWLGAFLTFAGFFIYLLLLNLTGLGSFTQVLGLGSSAGIFATIIMSGVIGKIGGIARAQKRDLVAQQQAAEHHLAQNLFLSMLNDIVQASLEVDNMDDMLKILVSRMGELFYADDCFITFWDDKRKLAIPKAAYGSNSEMYTSVVAKPGELTLTSSVLEAGHALVVENPHNSPYVDPQVVAPFPDILSSLVLPLVSGTRKLGAIILSFHSPREFSRNDIEWAELAARHISLAMTKLLLLEDTRKKVDEFAGLYEISSVVYQQENSRNIFGRLSEIMAHLLNVEICLISLYNPETDEFIPKASAFGIKDEHLCQLIIPKSLGEPTWDFAKTDVFVANSFPELPVEFQKYALLLNVQSVMVVPIWRPDRELLGLVYAANKPGGFDQEDSLKFGMFSAQASFVVQNTQLITSEHRRNEELSVLHAIASAAMTANNEDELIEFVTRMIGEKLYPDNFGILLLDEETNSLKLHSSYRLGLKETAISVPLGVGICGNVALSGLPRCVQDITQAPDYLSVDDRILSELCVPLFVEGKVIGVVNSESARLNAFSQRDEELLGIIAAQLTTTMQRLRAIDAQRKQNTHLERSNAMIKVLAQVGSRASSAVNPEGVMQSLGKELSVLGLFCLIALPDPDTQELSITYTSIPGRLIQLLEHTAGIKFGEIKIPRGKLKLLSDASLHPLLFNGPVDVVSNLLPGFPRQKVQRMLSALKVTSDMPICHLPLVVDGDLKGVFWLWGEDLQESDLPTMSIFASQVAIALQNSYLMAKVQKMALIDDLTGIFNRGHFFELAEHEFSQSRRYELPLSAIILDVDHFKKFNDRYGHIVGDQVLRNVASVLQANLREHDILGRYGGEEFAILMPVTDLKAAQVVAMRLKTCVAESRVVTDAGPVGVNISIGVSELNPEMPTLLSLIHRADQAMYIAKSTGGNGVATK
jgi:diguanylate cyclase (GGDEF)-like protein